MADDRAPYCLGCGLALNAQPQPGQGGPSPASPAAHPMIGGPGFQQPSAPAAISKQTMIGVAPGPMQPPPTSGFAQPAPPALDPKRTMLGMPQGPQASVPAAPSMDPKRTMLGGMGMPAPGGYPPTPGTPYAEPAAQPAYPPQSQAPQFPQQFAQGYPPQQPAYSQPQGPYAQPAGAPQNPAQPPYPQPQMPGADKRTMIGVALPGIAPAQSSGPVQPPAQGPLPGDKRTMMGVAMPGIAPVQQAPGPVPGRGGPPGSDKRTMMGVAMPGIAPVPGGAIPQGAGALPSDKRTMMGVAMPGIAPTPQFQPPDDAFPEAPPVPRSVVPAPAEPMKRRRRRVRETAIPMYRRPAFVLAVAGVSAAIAAVIIALLVKSPPPLQAEARIDSRGQDFLRVGCADCPDKTVLSINGAKGEVQNHVADIALHKPLNVGDNRLTVEIDRPGSGRDESLQLVVPIAYRIHPDLSALREGQTVAQIAVEAPPGSRVVIGGTPVSIGADGKGSYVLDTTAECTGASADAKPLDRSIPYEITPPHGKTDKGQVTVKLMVTPLVLDSPRPFLVVDGADFLVAGRTAKGATVEVQSARFTAGPDGSFSQGARLGTMGASEIRIRAWGKDLAPRVLTVKVKQVPDLEAEGQAFAESAKLSLPVLLSQIDAHKGEPIALQGEVFESRAQPGHTVVLLDVPEGCKPAPCLVRLIRGGVDVLPKGEKVRVFGYVAGAYDFKGRSVPELDVAFLLKGKKK